MCFCMSEVRLAQEVKSAAITFRVETIKAALQRQISFFDYSRHCACVSFNEFIRNTRTNSYTCDRRNFDSVNRSL